MLKHIKQVNENSFLLDFGDIIDVAISKYLINFSNYIINDNKNIKKLGIKNCTPSFNKILLQFDPISSSKKKKIKYLEKIEVQKKKRKIN
jgi:Allophanate hydrolase subunit 1